MPDGTDKNNAKNAQGKQQLEIRVEHASGGAAAEKGCRLLHGRWEIVSGGGASFGACAVSRAADRGQQGGRGAEGEEKSVPQAHHPSPVVFV